MYFLNYIIILQENKMKKKIVYLLLTLILLVLVFYHPLKKSPYESIPAENFNTLNKEFKIQNQGLAFKIAKQVWIEEYGYKSILFRQYYYRFVDNKYWIIVGVKYFDLIFKVNAGELYIMLDTDGKVINIYNTSN